MITLVLYILATTALRWFELRVKSKYMILYVITLFQHELFNILYDHHI